VIESEFGGLDAYLERVARVDDAMLERARAELLQVRV
jgi:hypothetical protein